MGLSTNSVGALISKSTVFLVRFPIGILIARLLGPEGKGFLLLLITSVMLGALIGRLGLGTAAIYYIGRNRAHLPAVVGNLLAVTAVTSVIVGGVGWMLLQSVRPDIYAQLPLWMWSLTALLIPVYILRSLLQQVLSAILRIKEINLFEVIAVSVHLLLFVLFVVILDGGIEGAFLAQASADLFITISFFVMVLRYGGRPARPDLSLLGISLRFGMKSYLYNLIKQLNLRLDAFVVTYFAVSGVYAAGVYSAASGLAELMIFIPESIRLSLFPMVAASSAVEAKRLTLAACRHTLLLSVICALGLAVFGPFAIHHIYGSPFAGAVTPLLILLPGVGMLALGHILYGDLNGRGKPETTAVSALVSLTVMIALDFMLIPRYGIIGAAIASTCAYTVEFIVTGYFFIRHSGARWGEMFALQRTDFDHYISLYRKAVTMRS